MKVKIIKAELDTYWYADKIGQIFKVEHSDMYKDYYLAVGYEAYISKYDCIEVDEQDTIVETVITKFQQRSEAGIKKYGTTLDRNDLTEKEWFTHLQEELMDATLYVERILKALNERK